MICSGAAAAREGITLSALVDAIKGSHLSTVVEGLDGVEEGQLTEIAVATRRDCTISIAIGGAVTVTYEIQAVD